MVLSEAGEFSAMNVVNAEKEKMRSMNVATRTRSKGFCGAGTTIVHGDTKSL